MKEPVLAENEEPVEGYPYLCRMRNPARCGGRVTVIGSRVEPKYVAFYVKTHGEEWFLQIWDYIPIEAIPDCLRYIKDHPEDDFDIPEEGRDIPDEEVDRLKSWTATEDDIGKLIALNRVVAQLEIQVKADLIKINGDLLSQLKEMRISDFEIGVCFAFLYPVGIWQEIEVVNVRILGDVKPSDEPSEFEYLGSCKNWNEFCGIENHPLQNVELCYIMSRAVMTVSSEERHLLFEVDRVWADTRPTIQRLAYAPSFKGEQFSSARYGVYKEAFAKLKQSEQK